MIKQKGKKVKPLSTPWSIFVTNYICGETGCFGAAFTEKSGYAVRDVALPHLLLAPRKLLLRMNFIILSSIKRPFNPIVSLYNPH
jgi:hypothetical protein